MKLKSFLTAFLICFLSIGCSKSTQVTQVEREDLFSLNIGKLEDQIALINLEGDMGIRHADLSMRNGLFYVSDGKGGKILRFNSYGDLLFMIYNEETNPPPLSLKPLSEGNLVTRWAISHPLLEPGEITVDSKQHIYVRDRLPYENYSFDNESKSLLNSTILHFDAEGKFAGNIGCEGVEGRPFPKIEGLYTSIHDELAVVCRLPNGWNIYWYNSEGTFLFVVQIKSATLPIPRDRENVFPSLDTISVAPDSRTLYIKVDYYRNTYDESTNMRTGIEPDGSVIWIMSVEEGLWDRYVEIPFFEYTFTEQGRRITSRMLYSLLGVIKNGRVFLTFPVEDGYSILIMPTESYGEQHNGFIRVDKEELQFNAFDLSAEGILSGLLVDEWQVKLVWWRTDKFWGEGS